MGPFMYNIFTNDLLLMMEKVQLCSFFNHADDKSVSDLQGTFLDVKTVIKGSCNFMINWFSDNVAQSQSIKDSVFSLCVKWKKPCSYA